MTFFDHFTIMDSTDCGYTLLAQVYVSLKFQFFLVARTFWLTVSDRVKVRLRKSGTPFSCCTLDLCGSCM